MFQIVRIDPVYCQITDGLIGSKARPRPMAYFSEALAHKLAGRLADEEYNNCGDSSFVVVQYGQSAYASRRYPVLAAQAADPFDMPF